VRTGKSPVGLIAERYKVVKKNQRVSEWGKGRMGSKEEARGARGGANGRGVDRVSIED